MLLACTAFCSKILFSDISLTADGSDNSYCVQGSEHIPMQAVAEIQFRCTRLVEQILAAALLID